MSHDCLEKFIKKLAKDPKLTEEFKNAADKGTDEAYKFALKHSGGHFEKKEFEDYMIELTKEYAELASEKLEDSTLTGVAGGVNFDDVRDDTLRSQLQSIAAEQEKILEDNDKKAKDRVKWIKGSGTIAKLTSTIANIGFSLFKTAKENQNKQDNSENIKIAELKEQIAIKKLEEQLKKLGIEDYESLLD